MRTLCGQYAGGENCPTIIQEIEAMYTSLSLKEARKTPLGNLSDTCFFVLIFNIKIVRLVTILSDIIPQLT